MSPPHENREGIILPDDAFARLFEAAARGAVSRTSREEGVVFLKSARETLNLQSLAYSVINIPAPGHHALFTHCYFSDRFMRHAIAARCEDLESVGVDNTNVLPLRTTSGERAFLIVGADEGTDVIKLEELRLIGAYFHTHICRINGVAPVTQDLSGRELDCLQWTAAGKTAWEAGVILGLTERTVRFHLNTAREKLKCATTAQAVAKAVAGGLICA